MILTVIVTTLLEIALAALCFTAGCVYWDMQTVPSPTNFFISDTAKDLLKKNNYKLYVGKSHEDEDTIVLWLRNLNSELYDEPIVLINPKKRTLEVLK